MFEVPDSGGTPKSVTKLNSSRGEASHRWPQVLPGECFLYWVQGQADVPGIYAASLAKPAEAKLLVLADANALYAAESDGRGYLMWLRGGALVAQELDLVTLKLTGELHRVADPVTSVGLSGVMNAAASAGGLLLYSAYNTRGQFAWLDRTGKPLDRISAPGEYGNFRLSPDGHRITIQRDRPGGTDIWVLEVGRGVSNRITFNSNVSNYPIWSPEGRTVLFSGGTPQSLFLKDSGGAGAERRLTQSLNNQNAQDWSHDGLWILYFEATPGTELDLWVLPMTPEGEVAAGAKPSSIWARVSTGRGAVSFPNPIRAGWPISRTNPDKMRSTSMPFPSPVAK